MKSKPIVMEHFSIVHTSFVLDFELIGRNPKNLFTTKDNLFELASETKGEQTVLRIKSYL